MKIFWIFSVRVDVLERIGIMTGMVVEFLIALVSDIPTFLMTHLEVQIEAIHVIVIGIEGIIEIAGVVTALIQVTPQKKLRAVTQAMRVLIETNSITTKTKNK
jgi:hypothetical protein